MKVKICGLKTLENSWAACEAGADMLGFNFYEPSSRYIHADTCRKIISQIKTAFPKIICVGVFVNHTPNQIKTVITAAGLDLAQLSGNEPLDNLEQCGDSGFKALRPVTLQEAEAKIQSIPARTTPPAFLLDTHQKGAYGGTGKTGDWELAAEIAKKHHFLLAGGLNPENVSAAVRDVEPWGVDVASGVEKEGGRKDPEKIKIFIQNARAASFEICRQ